MAVVLKGEHLRDLIDRYNAGASVFGLWKETGIGRAIITRSLLAAGVVLRDMSDAQRNRMGKLTPSERLANATPAHDAARARPQLLEERCKRAMSKSRIVGKYELEVVQELRARGIQCEHQFPFGPYNLDIWLCESRVAVEIYRAHPRISYMAHIHKRTEDILSAGAHQATVQCTYPRGVFDISSVCDQVVAFAEFCRRHHPAGGQHGVIRGHGKLSATSSHETNGRPLVKTLYAALDPS